jgi:hypothetical protein
VKRWQSSDSPEVSLRSPWYRLSHQPDVNCFTPNCDPLPQFGCACASTRNVVASARSMVIFHDDVSCQLAFFTMMSPATLHTIEGWGEEDRNPGDGAARCLKVRAVVLNLGALINRDLDLSLIMPQFNSSGRPIGVGCLSIPVRHNCSDIGDI